MSEQRMSRKELHQPDQIQLWLYAASNFIYKKRKLFIAGIVLFTVAIISVFYGHHYYQAQQIKQANLIYEAKKHILVNSGKESQNQAIQAFNQFLKDYSDTVNSAIALMHLGELHTIQKNWGQAEQAYKKVIEHPKAIPSMITAAKLSLIAVYENQQMFDTAKQAAESIDGENWEDIRLRTLAQIALTKGDLSTAKSHLEQLIKNTPNSEFTQEANTLLLTINP
ncbi:MAG: tetratricopeptide repeat protein [SAR324 cluster bacterium]|nr:tetratricopeptide repeat protein [SAR324 cluster bacterium]